MARVWRWLTTRMTYRPRRITVAAWFLIYLFSHGIDRLVERYSRPLARADEWFLLAAIPVGIALFGWVWWSGRDARRVRRSRA